MGWGAVRMAHTGMEGLAPGQQAWAGPDAEAAGDVNIERLHTTIANSAPLAARGCWSLDLVTACMDGVTKPALGESTVAALGAVFGTKLTRLEVSLNYSHPLQPSFWPALPIHLPNLNKCMVHGWPADLEDLVVLGAQMHMADSYRGPALDIETLTAPALAPGLRTALNLPAAEEGSHSVLPRLPRR